MRLIHATALAGMCAAALWVAGCGGSESASPQDVTVKFAVVNGEHGVSCGADIDGLGTSKATAQLMDARLYVSDVKLLPRDGGAPVPLTVAANDTYTNSDATGAVTMLDFEDGSGKCKEDGDAGTNTEVRGTVPEGDYTGVEFTVGVPEGMNHTDPTAVPAPLNLTSMSWNWQAGRKFTKIEVTDPGQGRWAEKAFMVHLGSTGCTGDPAAGEEAKCMHPNRGKVVLKDMDLATATIAMDLAKLFQGSDVTKNTDGSAAGCMSGPDDPECKAVFANLGVDWKADGTGTGQVVGDGSGQIVFRVM